MSDDDLPSSDADPLTALRIIATRLQSQHSVRWVSAAAEWAARYWRQLEREGHREYLRLKKARARSRR